VRHLRPVPGIHEEVWRLQAVLPLHGARRKNSGGHESKLVIIFRGSDEKKLGERNSMSMSDPIADYLTRVRNAVRARHKKVDVPASNLKKEITRILMEQKFIANFTTVEDKKQGVIRIQLKYNDTNSVITGLRRISRPGIRRRASARQQRPWCCGGVDAKRIDDRQASAEGKCRRRGIVLHLVTQLIFQLSKRV